MNQSDRSQTIADISMASFYIENFGCRATAADTVAIEHQLLTYGLARTDAQRADMLVVNTCTVTASADAQAREAIRQLHRRNPSARIVVTGCYAQRAPEELAQLEGVALIVGNTHLSVLPQLATSALLSAPEHSLVQIQRIQSGAPPSHLLSLAHGPAKILTGNIFEQASVAIAPAVGAELGAGCTRPILKIQDGCNHRCAYCVLPFVRGRSRSLPPAQVVDRIRRLVSAGAKEVVLSGINLGSYGRDLLPRVEFGDLLRRILDETSLDRLRISSIEPMDVTQDLVELVASSRRIARHFHIPLQSGSDRILATMHRWYRTTHYARRLELIRERLPGASIGADVIAGFPGEAEDDHRESLDFLSRQPFSYLHVFAFSARPSTAAAALPHPVPQSVIKQRARDLRALADGKSAAFRASQAGAGLRVLTLNRRGGQTDDKTSPLELRDSATDGWTEALSDNYLKLRVPGAWPANRWLDVRVGTEGDCLLTESTPNVG